MSKTANLKERQIAEAKARINILKAKGYEPQVIYNNIASDGSKPEFEIVISERRNILGKVIGCMYTPDEFMQLPGTPETKAIFAELEKTGAVPYAATAEHMEYGDQLTVLAVSKYEEEWERDREELNDNMACAFVGTDSDWAEWGMVGFKVAGGGLVRTY